MEASIGAPEGSKVSTEQLDSVKEHATQEESGSVERVDDIQAGAQDASHEKEPEASSDAGGDASDVTISDMQEAGVEVDSVEVPMPLEGVDAGEVTDQEQLHIEGTSAVDPQGSPTSQSTQDTIQDTPVDAQSKPAATDELPNQEADVPAAEASAPTKDPTAATPGGADHTSTQQKAPAVLEEDAAFCGERGLSARAEGRRRLLAGLVSLGESDEMLLHAALRELAGVAAFVGISSPSHSLTQGQPRSSIVQRLAADLNAAGTPFAFRQANTGNTTLEDVHEAFSVQMTEQAMREAGYLELMVAHTRWRQVWDDLVAFAPIASMQASDLLLLGRVNEIPSKTAMRIAVACDVPTPVHFETQTYRFRMGCKQAGVWARPEVYSLQELGGTSISMARLSRKGGSEERSTGGFPTSYTAPPHENVELKAPGLVVQDAGWHLDLFGGVSSANSTVTEHLLPSDLAQLSQRIPDALTQAMAAGHDVLFPSDEEWLGEPCRSEVLVSELPTAFAENTEAYAWAI